MYKLSLRNKLLLVLSCSSFLASSAMASPLSYTFNVNAVSANLASANGDKANQYYFLNSSHTSRGLNPEAKASLTFTPTVGNMGTVNVSFTDLLTQTRASDNRYTTGVEYQVDYQINNAILSTNPDGIMGLGLLGATGSGNFKIINAGDVTGDGLADSIEYSFMTKFMNFATDANANNPNSYISELKDVGSANFFMWNSDLLNDLLAKVWYQSTGNIFVNGQDGSNLFSLANGDIHLNNGGTAVPEPTTVALLLSGVLGGAAKRRKRKTA